MFSNCDKNELLQFSQNGKKNNSHSKNSIQKDYTVHENEVTFEMHTSKYFNSQ